MSDCCLSSNTPKKPRKSRKHYCPVSGKEHSIVSSTTICHHLKEPWNWKAKDQTYYFCSDPKCEVVYFGEDDSTILKPALRMPVGIKSDSSDRLLCYCYGVTLQDVLAKPEVRDFVVNETKGKNCACEIRNPSGRCCLKDFPK